jgi:hypothetical protein
VQFAVRELGRSKKRMIEFVREEKIEKKDSSAYSRGLEPRFDERAPCCECTESVSGSAVAFGELEQVEEVRALVSLGEGIVW